MKRGVSFRALGLHSLSPQLGFTTIFPGASRLSVRPSVRPLFIKYVLRASSTVLWYWEADQLILVFKDYCGGDDSHDKY